MVLNLFLPLETMLENTKCDDYILRPRHEHILVVRLQRAMSRGIPLVRQKSYVFGVILVIASER